MTLTPDLAVSRLFQEADQPEVGVLKLFFFVISEASK
jgi:hypothetical protein